MDEEFLNTTPTAHPTVAPAADLSVLLIGLLKGVLYRDGDERQWAALLNLQARVRDYVAVLNLDLVLDEAEGYAFLKSRPEPADDDPSPHLPRLVARRPLSFAVSLLLALLFLFSKKSIAWEAFFSLRLAVAFLLFLRSLSFKTRLSALVNSFFSKSSVSLLSSSSSDVSLSNSTLIGG